MTLKEKIEKYHEMFEVQDRKGEDIIVLGPNASKKLEESVKRVKGDRVMDDWTFATYYSILYEMVERELKSMSDLKNERDKICEDLIGEYPEDLTEWLDSDVENIYFLEKAVKELKEKELGKADGFKILSKAQYLAIQQIYDEVLNLLKD